MGDLGKLIVAKGFKKLPKLQEIAQSGHTGGPIIDCSLAIVGRLAAGAECAGKSIHLPCI